MTGYGTAVFILGGIRGVVEIKSVNHRYNDISYYLPVGFSSLENKIRPIILKSINRGRVNVAVKLTQKPPQTISFNKNAVKKYLQYAHVLNKEFNLKNNLTLADLIRLPGVVEANELLMDPEELWPAVEKGLARSLDSLEKMRGREGYSLAADINQNLKQMSERIKNIQARTKKILSEKKKQLTEEEFLSFQKSADIGEEQARLAHYIDEVKALLKSSTPVGKKLDFVAQEMQRETNTIGSKVQDSVVSNAVITLKSKIEKIREQVQNIE